MISCSCHRICSGLLRDAQWRQSMILTGCHIVAVGERYRGIWALPWSVWRALVSEFLAFLPWHHGRNVGEMPWLPPPTSQGNCRLGLKLLAWWTLIAWKPAVVGYHQLFSFAFQILWAKGPEVGSVRKRSEQVLKLYENHRGEKKMLIVTWLRFGRGLQMSSSSH